MAKMVISLRQQCHHKLEQERTEIVTRLQRLLLSRETNVLDPVAQQVLQQTYEKLQSIDLALERLARGKFGLCKMCQQPINDERLLMLPYAELCIDCKRQLEQTPLGRHSLKRMSNVTV
jgi:RNA polymerase-binding transcription factor DksA